MHFCYFAFVVLMRACVFRADLLLEPACSKFDYDEKVLAKVMRLEETITDLVNRVTNMETTLNENSNKNEVSKTTCPSSYMFNKEFNLCLRYQKTPTQNWFDAEKICQNEGGHLMIFNSSGSAKFIREYLKASGAVGAYLGASDIQEEGEFKWYNGKSVQELPWHSGQPNDGTSGNCLYIHSAYDYYFGDIGCGNKYGKLCQIDMHL